MEYSFQAIKLLNLLKEGDELSLNHLSEHIKIKDHRLVNLLLRLHLEGLITKDSKYVNGSFDRVYKITFKGLDYLDHHKSMLG